VPSFCSRQLWRYDSLIIAGRIYVVPEHREEHLASLEDLIRRARAQPGCPDFVIAGDPAGSDRVNLIEQWESQEHLAAWRAVAHPPAPVTDVLNEDVALYEISTSGPVFP
jgi:quinol monooxygenase YgiN